MSSAPSPVHVAGGRGFIGRLPSCASAKSPRPGEAMHDAVDVTHTHQSLAGSPTILAALAS